MQRELRPPPTVPTLPVIIEELEQQQRQVQVFYDQLESVGQMNDHLVMMTQQRNKQTDPSFRDHREGLRTQAEQQIISLEQLAGYVLQQQAQLQRLRSELERLQVEIANQQQVLLTYQFASKSFHDVQRADQKQAGLDKGQPVLIGK